MKRFLLGLLMLAAVGGAVLADTKADADVDKMLGTWTFSAIEIKGKNIPAPEGSGGTLIFAKDNKLTMKDKGKADKNGTYRLDAGKSPKEIDLIESKEEGKEGEKTEGIYELKDDTLRIAVAPEGPKGKRPTALDSNKAIIMILKREKK